MISLFLGLPVWVWAVGVLSLWNIVLTVIVVKSLRNSKALFGGAGSVDLKSILQEHINRVGGVQIKLGDLEKMLVDLQGKSRRYISKVGVVRYNPFDDTGGDQSFVVALMDENCDGVVITSMHGRDRTRMYSKPIKLGASTDYEFSKEEIEAIKKASSL